LGVNGNPAWEPILVEENHVMTPSYIFMTVLHNLFSRFTFLAVTNVLRSCFYWNLLSVEVTGLDDKAFSDRRIVVFPLMPFLIFRKNIQVES